jgi:carbonic anhydrase/acetyltransferase-like protein (isoleucine patch superfamily)
MANSLPTLLVILIWGLPLGALWVGLSRIAQMGESVFLSALILAPMAYSLLFVFVAAAISMICHRKIISGRFPRENFDKVYFWRRIYGTCWTQVFYFKPIYASMLPIPIFKKMLFKLFGYKGTSLQFTIYPDTWIRDLPLLDFGAGAYLSNRATLGTNMCLPDNTIFVDKITVAAKGLLGHLGVLAPGCKIMEEAEVGVSATLGVRCRLKPKASVKPGALLNHGVVVGAGAEIGTRAFVGLRARIGDGVKVPAGACIPAGSVINSEEDLQNTLAAEKKMIADYLEELKNTYLSPRI